VATVFNQGAARVSIPVPPDIRPGRLSADEYAKRFSDVSPRLPATQALIEAERCLYCFDAPCTSACPTHIDVPSFIKRIADGNLRGSARTILESNPLGGMCARVCPTEVLCEQVCVRNTQEGRPVAIGRLQRYAVDAVLLDAADALFSRAEATGKRIAVVGAGPAGLACAHTLARLGHEVVLFDARPKAGGLNEYGLAAYKTPDGFAQRELGWLLSIGGIEVRNDWKLESSAQLDVLRKDYDALFLGLGLAGTPKLGIAGEALGGVQDAVDFIATLRQSSNLATLPVGRRVVVIGGGMTAIDAAVQSRLLGAQVVHLVYRRGPQAMPASRAEQDWAQTQGVSIRHWLAPVEIMAANGHVSGVRFEHQNLVNDKLTGSGEFELIEADMVLKAIGQQMLSSTLAQAGIALEGGRIATDSDGLTSLPAVWAGGDCRAGGLDLTVQAVANGKHSALSIHAELGGA
jgi:glutamate synthase (NADPH/NADH) small chain